MTENVGSIRYTTEVDTSDTLTAEKQIDKATTDMSNDFKKVDVAAKKTQTQMTKTAKSVKKGVVGMGRGAGQAGIQLQQFIGQVQGGQSVMLALSQQSTDLGFVLGVPLVGAVVGISASLIGMLIPSLGKTKDKFDELNQSATTLTSNFELLTDDQQALAGALLAHNLAEQQKEIDKTTKKVKELRIEYTTSRTRLKKGSFFVDKDDVKENLKLLTEGQALLLKQQGELAKTKKSIADLNTESIEQIKIDKEKAEVFKKVSKSLEAKIMAFDNDAEAMLRWSIRQQLGLTSVELLDEGIEKQIKTIGRLTKAKEDEAKTKTEKKQAESFATGVTKRGQSPEDKLQADLEQLIRDEALVSLEQFEAAKTAIEKQQSELRQKQREEETKQAVSAQSMMAGAVLSFISATTSAVMSGMDEQSGAYKALFAIQKATQIASTIINAETAATAALAAFPGPAGIALSNIVRGLGYASAGIIAGTAISGGRQFGGPVNSGDAYRVGEAGPEIFTAGGKNFMIPGENGKVIANDDINGGGGFTQNVEIINNTPSNVTSQTSNDGKQLRIFINEVANQINNNQGVISKALKSSTNVNFKANS